MLAAKSDAAAQAFQKRESLSALQGLPLAERAERAILNHGKGNFRYLIQLVKMNDCRGDICFK